MKYGEIRNPFSILAQKAEPMNMPLGRREISDKNAVLGAHGSVMVEALYCKPEGRGFETRRGECIFSIYLILPAALGHGVYSASNRSEYQKQKNNVSGE
jgi:hypothetical protein